MKIKILFLIISMLTATSSFAQEIDLDHVSDFTIKIEGSAKDGDFEGPIELKIPVRARERLMAFKAAYDVRHAIISRYKKNRPLTELTFVTATLRGLVKANEDSRMDSKNVNRDSLTLDLLFASHLRDNLKEALTKAILNRRDHALIQNELKRVERGLAFGVSAYRRILARGGFFSRIDSYQRNEQKSGPMPLPAPSISPEEAGGAAGLKD